MVMHPETLDIAIREIERFEGIELDAYLDPVGVPTICAGLTRYPNGSPVRMGDVCRADICRSYLRLMLQEEFGPKLATIPGWAELGPKRQAALLSFAWNLGAGFYGATGFETISRVLREGAARAEVYQEMGNALALYVKAGGQTLPGLVNRRKAEAELWNQESNGIMKFKANQQTFLKKAAIDSRYLSDQGKRSYAQGDVISVSRLEEIPADSHAWVTMDGGTERWIAFLPHWEEQRAKPNAVAPKTVNWSDFGSPVGEYITVGEVLQYDARRRPKPGSAEEKSIIAICKEFDAIRKAWDGPLGITSGYRPEPINSQVGGVPGSYHTKGMALDIYPIGESLEKFHQWLLQRWSGGYGDGRHRGFIHIDTRNNGCFNARAGVKPAAVWTY
jgi:GH24 family phage-related lysozyme (muramidase)